MQAPVPVALTQAQVAAVVTEEAAVQVALTQAQVAAVVTVEAAVRVADTPEAEVAVQAEEDSPEEDVPVAEVQALADKTFNG